MDEKFRSRRWMLVNRILATSFFMSAASLLIGTLLAPDQLAEIISSVLVFMGTVNGLVSTAYLVNRSTENFKHDTDK